MPESVGPSPETTCAMVRACMPVGEFHAAAHALAIVDAALEADRLVAEAVKAERERLIEHWEVADRAVGLLGRAVRLTLLAAASLTPPAGWEIEVECEGEITSDDTPCKLVAHAPPSQPVRSGGASGCVLFHAPARDAVTPPFNGWQAAPIYLPFNRGVGATAQAAFEDLLAHPFVEEDHPHA